MKRILRIFLCIAAIFMICGCSTKIKYDPQYGVWYLGPSESNIRITVDPNNSKTISKLTITATGDLIGNSKGIEIYEVNKPSDEDGSIPVEYYKSELMETIVIRFYSDNMKQEDLNTLSECLGFDFTAKTNIKDLVNSDTFKYKEIIENGDFLNDISFFGNKPFKGDLN